MIADPLIFAMAYNRIKTKGWVQHRGQMNGRMCTSEAISYCTRVLDPTNRTTKRMTAFFFAGVRVPYDYDPRNVFKLTVHRVCSIVDWNDAKGREQGEVESFLQHLEMEALCHLSILHRLMYPLRRRYYLRLMRNTIV